MKTTLTKQELEIIKSLIADKAFGNTNISLHDSYLKIYTKIVYNLSQQAQKN